MSVVESGMTFIIKNEDNLFYIEKSQLYKGLSTNSIKIAEFLYIDDKTCYIIEAKSSSPNPNNSEERFDEYIEEIKAKFINAYTIYIANRLQRHTQNDFNEMQKPFQNLNLKSQTFSFVLIIKEHKTDWLSPISDSLKQRIKVFLKSWNIKDADVKVLNEEIARDKGFII